MKLTWYFKRCYFTKMYHGGFMVPSCGPQECPLKLILVDVYAHPCFSQPTLHLLTITLQTVHRFVLF